MNKRITSILLCFVMLFSMLVSAVPAYAAPADPPMVIIEADRTEANPGDTITYKFYLQQPDTMTAFAFNMVAPDGLTYVEGSGTLGSTASAAWGSTFEWVPEADLQLQWYSSSGDDVTDTSKIELITIQFKVADDATIGAEYELSLTNMQLAAGSTQNYDDISSTVEVTTAKVKVVAKPVAVTGVTIDETLSVKTGESKTPSYTVNPAEATNKTVSFKSDNTAVATVNETTGEVTGVKAGTATITVTTADGNFTDTCTVTVSCAHASKTSVAAKASTCKTPGWDAYQTCDGCGQLFAADGSELDAIPTLPLNASNHEGSAGDWKQTADTHKKEYTCCETPAVAEADHTWNNGVCSECGYNCSHTGGTATCVDKKECTKCGTKYGDLDPDNHVGGTYLDGERSADHNAQQDGYTGDTKCESCKGTIIYGTAIPAGEHEEASQWSQDANQINHWKDCTVPNCEYKFYEGQHVSTGANAATCQREAVCDICGLSYGDKARHEFKTTWSNDEDGHWYACKTDGCQEKDSYAGHTPDHQGGATEEYAILCSVCLYVMEPQLNHSHTRVPMTKVDEEPKTCTTPGNKAYYKCNCGSWFWDEEATEEIVNKDDVVIPEGHDWNEEEWGYFDESGHAHTCQAPGCNANDTIQPHELSAWKYDDNIHWKECECEYKFYGDNQGVHVDEDDDGICDVCDRDSNVTVYIPFVKVVEQTGQKTPGEMTFTFEVYNFFNTNAEGNVDIVANTIDTDGKGRFEGELVLKLTEDELMDGYLDEGFLVREVEETVEGWTYSEVIWYVYPNYATAELVFCDVVDGQINYNSPKTEMVFTNSYKADNPVPETTEPETTEPETTEPETTEPEGTEPEGTEPETTEPEGTESETTEPETTEPEGTESETTEPEGTEPENSNPAPSDPETDTETPDTGDNSKVGLWIVLLIISVSGIAAITIYEKKRRAF